MLYKMYLTLPRSTKYIFSISQYIFRNHNILRHFSLIRIDDLMIEHDQPQLKQIKIKFKMLSRTKSIIHRCINSQLDFTLYISYKTTFFQQIIVNSFLNGFLSFLYQKKQKYLKIICLF